MTVTDWLSQTVGRIRRDGVSGARRSAQEFYLGGLRRLGHVYNYGTPIFEEDWDVLLVLDACRADLMDEMADEYDFVTTDSAIYSVGSATEEWMEKTFTEEYADEIRRTAYVTGNPHSAEGLDQQNFADYEEVWTYAWDDDDRTVPARAVTDRAIKTARETNPDRMVVHYMQPHHPFVPCPELNQDIGYFEEATWNHIWEMLQEGATTEEEVWEGYRENLRYVLDDVELLLENLDAETVVITSDHGNALGEFGVYGHPLHVPIPSLKKVPWIVTSATDSGTYEPTEDEERVRDDTSEDVADRLRNLGYKQ